MSARCLRDAERDPCAMSGVMSGVMSGAMSGAMSGVMPGAMPGAMSGVISVRRLRLTTRRHHSVGQSIFVYK